MKKLIVPAILVVLVACGTTKAALTQADADRGAKEFSGLTLADLNQGQIDAEKYCAQCHQYKKPQTRTQEQWKEIVPRMAKKDRPGILKIDAKTEKSILAYYVTMSKPN